MSWRSSPELAEPPSSPPSLPSTQPCKPYKLKKPPPITPNRFNRFFNPRSSEPVSSKSAHALKELSASATNRANATKRHDSLSEPLPKRIRLSSPAHAQSDDPDVSICSSPLPASSPCQSQQQVRQQHYPPPLVRSKFSRVQAQVPFESYYADFVTTPEDTHHFTRPNLPFATAACNTNSLVAIGTEGGEIHLLESAKNSKPNFSETFLTFAPHQNAIMDLAFSSDDARLASASGDQTAKITDMRTQTPIYALAEHTSSLKQVVFQPGNEQIVATCSRDSVVALWDLRCANARPVIRNKQSSGSRDSGDDEPLDQVQSEPRYASIYKSISNWNHNLAQAHSSSTRHSSPLWTPPSSAEVEKKLQAPSNTDSFTTRPTASVTSIVFLPQSPHHIVTSSDASSCLRIWDIRSRHLSTRTRSATPVQLPVATSAPAPFYSNSRRRDYGTTCMTLSTDAARLFAVSRNNCVQVYSTQHLILGQAPQTLKASGDATQTGRQGAPPLYCLSHPQLRTGSFYIRASIRRTRPSSQWPELLAVGSSDHSIVLFPTDSHRKQADIDSQPAITGAQLQFGHQREVTGLAWTSNGELISCADDYVARVWREDRAQAMYLRNSETSTLDESGRRKGADCGWYQDVSSSITHGDLRRGRRYYSEWDEDEA